MKQAQLLKVELSNIKEFSSLYEQSLARDRKAFELWSDHKEQLSEVCLGAWNQEKIQGASARFKRYKTILDIAKHNFKNPLPEAYIRNSTLIDLKKDKVHVMQLAAKLNVNSSELFQRIKNTQALFKQTIFNQLEKDHPIVDEFEKLSNERKKATGFQAEQLDKLLLRKIQEITKNTDLSDHIQRYLPDVAKYLSLKIENNKQPPAKGR